MSYKISYRNKLIQLCFVFQNKTLIIIKMYGNDIRETLFNYDRMTVL